jgi:hypothetical protein
MTGSGGASPTRGQPPEPDGGGLMSRLVVYASMSRTRLITGPRHDL